MPTLNFNIIEADIDKLNYERYTYPDLLVQKRIFAVYLKATLRAENFLAGTASCRIEVQGVDELFEEYKKQGVIYNPGKVVEEQVRGRQGIPCTGSSQKPAYFL